jgi:hypothetical protein
LLSFLKSGLIKFLDGPPYAGRRSRGQSRSGQKEKRKRGDHDVDEQVMNMNDDDDNRASSKNVIFAPVEGVRTDQQAENAI